MTTSEKLIKIAENVQKNVEFGKSQGGGGDDWYDTFWDGYQNFGNRTNYSGFAEGTPHNGWFKPKYDIKPTTAESFMRNYGQGLSANEYVDLVQLLEDLNVVLDFSKCANVTYLFYNARIWHIPEVNITGASDSASNQLIFGSYTKKIDKFVVKETQLLEKPFNYATALEEIEIGGTIGRNFNMSKCVNLVAESYHSIITHCSKTKAFTLTLPPEATVRNVYDAKYGSGAWDAITAQYPNVTIMYS